MFLVWRYASDWVFYNRVAEGETRPFIYRALVPLLSHQLSDLGIDLGISYIIIVIMSFVLLLWMFQSLSKNWMYTYLMGCTLIVLAYPSSKSYDMTTSLLMLAGVILILQNRIAMFFVVFLLACINRETSIFLTLFSAIYLWRYIRISNWMYFVVSQLVIFVFIQSSIRAYFIGIPGYETHFRLIKNLNFLLSHPPETLFVLLTFLAIFWTIYSGWRSQPSYINIVAMSIFPLLVILYLCFGYRYEFRVFSDIYPFLFLMEVNYATKISSSQAKEVSKNWKDPVQDGKIGRKDYDADLVT